MSAKQLTAIDVSSWQRTNCAQLIAKYNPDHVIVRAYLPWEKNGYQDISRAQVATARYLGKSVGIYSWPYEERTPWETLVETINLCNSCNPSVVAPIIWSDCENSVYGDGPDANWLRGWRQAGIDLQTPVGLYVRVSWIDDYFDGGQDAFMEFNDLPIWVADYDGIDDVDIFPHGLPKGWTQAAAKQFAVTASPIGNCDRNVIRPEYTIYGHDPCAVLRDELVQMTAKLSEMQGRLDEIARLASS